jgi:acyl-CoA thioesterase I
VFGSVASLVFSACRSTPPVDPGCVPGSVIALGDSITFGAGLPATQNYPTQLSALLGKTVCNAGVNGDTAKGGLARLQRDVLQFHPSVVVILFGTNDSGLFASQGKRQTPVTDFQRNLQDIVTAVEVAGARPVLASLPPLNASLLRSQGLHPENWAEYDAVVRSVATMDGVPLADLSVAFGGDYSLLQDGIHPTTAGAAVIARTVLKLLNEPATRAAGSAGSPPARG